MYKYKIERHILCSEVYIKLYLDVVRCIFIIWLSAIKTQKNNAVFFYTWNMCVWWKGGVWTLEGGGQGGSFRKSYELSLKWVYHKFEHLPTSKPTLLKCHICKECAHHWHFCLYTTWSYSSSYNGNLKRSSKFAQRCPKVSPKFPLICP